MTPCPLKLALLTTLAKTVSGHYCEWDLCGSEQYCCGDNLCCDYVYSLWYFWVGIVFLVLLVSACGGLFRYYYRRWGAEGGPYQPFPTTPSYSALPTSPSYTSLPTNISAKDPLFQV